MTEKVLVADDHKEIRDFLAEIILRPKGFEVLTATNGLMALDMAIAERPDLMIADQQMPHLTGLQVLEKLHDRGIEIPAIVLTGRGSEDTAVKAFRLGIRDYIIKPVDADELSDSVDRALRESRLKRERDQLVKQLMESNSQLQRRAQELNVLYDVGKSVSSSLELEEVLQRVVEAAVYVVDAEEGSLMLLDEARGELYTRASKNVDSQAQTMRRRVTDSLAGQVLQTGRAIAIGADSPGKRTHTALLVKSLIYVPLIWQDTPIGVLGVTNKVKDSSFDGDDTRALAALGGYATIAIHNANIYRQIEQERNILGNVVDQADDPILVIDAADNLHLLNVAARRAFGLEDTRLLGQRINFLVDNQETLDLISQPTAENGGNPSFTAHDGHNYQVRVTVTESGSRCVVLKAIS